MDELPEPMVPPDVDLRDFDFIPLYGDRLFNSDTWALCDADEKVAALRLWWRAWHEEPAGSLPNNDRLLADRAGYGVAVKAFLAVKENAMRGWIECRDARLYHPVVASIALDVWAKKRKKRSDNEADRERKKNKRRGMSGGNTADVRRTEPLIPPDVLMENALKGREGDTDASASGAVAPVDPVKEIWDRGLAILGNGQRSLLGKLRKTYTDPAVLAAIVTCENECPSEPAAFLVACLERSKANGSRSAVAATKHAGALDTLARAALDFDERTGYRGVAEAAH